jgi:hypothetical protein
MPAVYIGTRGVKEQVHEREAHGEREKEEEEECEVGARGIRSRCTSARALASVTTPFKY